MHHVICKARHSTPSTEFKKKVYKVQLFISIISDSFLLDDPGTLASFYCWSHVFL